MNLLAIELSLLQRTQQLQRKLTMLSNGPNNPRKLTLPFGVCTPSYNGSLGLTRIFIQNGISIVSAVFLHSSP